MDRKRLTATEREGMLRIAVIMEILDREGEDLSDRLGLIRMGRCNWAMMRKKIHSIFEQLIDTMPDEQLKSFRNNLKMSSFTVGAKRPGGGRDDDGYGMWLSFRELNGLLSGCHDHCLMCNKDKGERRRCELRRTLDLIPNDSKELNDEDCPYFGLI